ncbi:MAG: WD40/YVTN/BNR-like repeat-containing protein [Acidimicrobiales bacterium]
MNKIHPELRTLDPVRMSALEDASSHPVFDELLEDIVAGPRDPLASRPAGHDELGRRQARSHRRLVVASMAGVAAALLVVAVLAAQSPSGTTHPGTGTGASATSGPVAAPKWRLVSDIDPSWRTVSALGSGMGVSLTCPSTTTCYAVNLDPQQSAPGTYNEIEVTHDGGDTWQESSLPVTLSDATGLACADADTCATLGMDASGNATFLETTDGGNTWATEAGPSQITSNIGVTTLACNTSESCVAVASDPGGQSGAALSFVTDDGGATWTDSNLPTDFVPGGQGSMQCLSAEDCVVSGFYQSPDGSPGIPPGTVLYTTDDATTWTAATLPPGLGPLGSWSCADATDCVASFFGDDGSSSEIVVSTDGGRSWSEADASGLPAAFLMGVSCPTASECWAGGLDRASGGSGGSGAIAVKLGPGAQGVVASTADGGQTWQSAQLPEGVMAVVSIACPSDTGCYAMAIQSPTQGSQASLVLLAYGG